MTAAKVPIWAATSIASPWSVQPVATGTRIRWADELIGRNSVIPWTIAADVVVENRRATRLLHDPEETAGHLLGIVHLVLHQASVEVVIHPRGWKLHEVQLPALTRGPDVMEGYHAGAEIEWGEDARLATTVEVGRREQVEEVDQLLSRVEQAVRIPTAAGPAVRARFGGVRGRWFVRDDWIAYTRWEIPVSLAMDVVPALYLGETLATDLAAAGREPATEARAQLGLDVRPSPRWRIRPTVGIGRVESDREDLTGTLREGMVRVDVTVVGTSRLQLFARHQDAPGSDPFTVVAAGFAVGFP